jgi:hypothetical protein
MTERPEFVLGHDPMGGRPNIRAEIKRLRMDPLGELIDRLRGHELAVLSNPTSLYQEAYEFYFLSLSRYLREMSVAARYSRGPYWVRRSSGKYTPIQRKLADEFNPIAPFLELDLVNCLLHSRILLDRVVGLSRYFLTGKTLPSFTSFSDHKKFFENHKDTHGAHEEYAEYIRSQTSWFEIPLQFVRDKFVVHAAAKHMRSLGYRSDHELDLAVLLPDNPRSDKPLGSVKVITVNALRLSYDIEVLLKWFCGYGLSALARLTNGEKYH